MKFDYGDAVVAKQKNEDGSISDRSCAVVGITQVATENDVRTFGHPIGTILYTVEFADGSDTLVPEDGLAPFTK